MNYFTLKRSFFLVYSSKCCEEFEKIDKFLEILEKSGIGKLIEHDQNNYNYLKLGRKSYNPYNLMATVIYCFSKFKSSLREIEQLCIFDVRVAYLMEQGTPDYSVIGDFINRYILPHTYEIFVMVTRTIIDEFNIDISNQYIDGTKLEANANKYKFVWKPTTFHKKLDSKIKELLDEIGYKFTSKELIKSYQLKNILTEYIKRENIDINNLPSGKGKRLSIYQKYYKKGNEYLLKLLEYEEKETICGENRKSYYKTDKAATAMVLKGDYYSKLSNDFHVAYNFQAMISSGFITMFGIFQDRTDYYTFTPMLDLYYKYYSEYPKNMCADSGYGIYTNYQYIREHNIGNYVKFQSWNGESSGKNPQLFYMFDDGVMCLDTNIGVEIKFGNTHQRSKNGKLYKFTGCNSCNYSYKCKAKLKEENKDTDYRIIEIIPDYELLKEQARNNLLSPKGIEIRINRSIQSEGNFGEIKENMGYDRIRRRGIDKVTCEVMLICLGRNIKKLFTLLDGNEIKSGFWKVPNDLKKEKFPYVKQKKKKELSRN